MRDDDLERGSADAVASAEACGHALAATAPDGEADLREGVGTERRERGARNEDETRATGVRGRTGPQVESYCTVGIEGRSGHISSRATVIEVCETTCQIGLGWRGEAPSRSARGFRAGIAGQRV